MEQYPREGQRGGKLHEGPSLLNVTIAGEAYKSTYGDENLGDDYGTLKGTIATGTWKNNAGKRKPGCLRVGVLRENHKR